MIQWLLKITLALTGALLLTNVPQTACAADTTSGMLSGVVVETTNSSGYTYLLIKDGQTKQWVATTTVDVKPGGKVEVPGGVQLKNFYSQKLQRSFPDIIFVETITVDGKQQNTSVMAAGHPNLNLAALGADGNFAGRVLATTNSGGYTFVCVQGFHKAAWAATTNLCKIKAGDSVSLPKGEVMQQFHSTSLNLTFDEIRFVDHIENWSQPGSTRPAATTAVPSGHPQITVPSPAFTADKRIEQPAGAKTVAEIFAQSRQLAGQMITIKGRVTKFMAGVMGRNWIHISDGTGTVDHNDLLITTTNTVAVGDVITVNGQLAIDQDFGLGYAYSVLIEKATVQKN